MKGPLLKKVNAQTNVNLKGWWLDTLNEIEDSPFGESFRDLVLRSAGEAMELVMEADDTLLYCRSSRENPLILTLVFPIGDDEDVEWELDLDRVLRGLLSYPELEEIEDLQSTRDALQALATAFDAAISGYKGRGR